MGAFGGGTCLATWILRVLTAEKIETPINHTNHANQL
jgi:hypothetical protein